MVYTPTPPIRRTGWTDDQRDEMTALERITRPSDYARGNLTALRLTATTDSDLARVAAVVRKWERKR